ncbi:MAG TPA: glycosyltransferase family 39 protein, partial [Candidatus Goldiibacteriota bacterium]|nr:glycosyltransferase family 39 protein [Candidatus Goldiibacteriota bacterium]
MAQYNLFRAVVELRKYSLTLFFIFLFFALVFVLLAFTGLNMMYALSVLPLIAGTVLFYYNQSDFYGIPFFGVFALMLILAYLPGDKDIKNFNPVPAVFYYIAAAVAVMLAVTFIADTFFASYDDYIGHYFPLRQRGLNLDGMTGFVFNRYDLLVPAILLVLFVISVQFAVFKGKISNPAAILAVLLCTAFAAKLLFALMSSQGIGIFEAKTKAADNTAYYFYAKKVTDISQFLGNYVDYYQGKLQSSHLMGHPPLPVLFYWLILKYISQSAAVAGYIYSFVTALAVIPFYFLIKRITKNQFAAFSGSVLYALTPNSIMLSTAGADGMTVLFLASFLWLLLKGSAENKPVIILLAGISFGVGTMLTFGIWPLLMFSFLIVPDWNFLKDRTLFKKEMIKWLRDIDAVLLGVVLTHILFWLLSSGKFDYAASFLVAKARSMPQMLTRPYELWSWINVVHWAHYFTAPLAA